MSRRDIVGKEGLLSFLDLLGNKTCRDAKLPIGVLKLQVFQKLPKISPITCNQ